MEALSEAPDETASNSSLVKSEGSPQHEGGRSSPPPNCAICLGRCRNKSFTDSCLHQFCFKCLLTWSRVKTECPLCKQNFKSIIHNVKSNHQYEEYPVEQPRTEERGHTLEDISEMVNVARRFRYRTTLTLPRRDSLAIQQILMHYPLAAALVGDLPPRPAAAGRRTRRSAADFRRTVYRHNLWARPLPDFTGRFRDCTPEFFRYNSTQVHRLMPWLNRELYYLLNENSGHISYVMERILELLPQHPIISAEFSNAMTCYFGERTEHFLHEFFCFASTPYDITGYDRHVQYQTDSRVSAVVNEVLSSSDSDSRDSDIVMVSSSHAAPPPAVAPAPGPSRPPAPVYPRAHIPQPAVIPIETISHSDSDSSEVMVVGYIKPPHARTPELVDLLGSDSDVVVQDAAPAPAAAEAPLVRLKLTVPRRPAADSESDSSYTPPPPPAPRRKRRAPSPSASDGTRTPPFSSEDDDSYDDSTDSSSCDRSPPAKRRPRKKSGRRPARRRRAEERQYEREKRRKGKSRSGKDVKSSSVDPTEIPLPSEPAPDRAGPSGVDARSRGGAEAVLRRASREIKRLKSVVNVMKREHRLDDDALQCSSPASVSDSTTSRHAYERNPGAGASCGELSNHSSEHCRVRTAPLPSPPSPQCTRLSLPSPLSPRDTHPDSSDDDIPLQLTINRNRGDAR